MAALHCRKRRWNYTWRAASFSNSAAKLQTPNAREQLSPPISTPKLTRDSACIEGFGIYVTLQGERPSFTYRVLEFVGRQTDRVVARRL